MLLLLLLGIILDGVVETGTVEPVPATLPLVAEAELTPQEVGVAVRAAIEATVVYLVEIVEERRVAILLAVLSTAVTVLAAVVVTVAAVVATAAAVVAVVVTAVEVLAPVEVVVVVVAVMVVRFELVEEVVMLLAVEDAVVEEIFLSAAAYIHIERINKE